ncbi:hypothetical protein LCGC14_2399780, partial [marine sediment metagenome]
NVEKQNKKAFGVVGIMSASLVAVIDYFLRRGG